MVRTDCSLSFPRVRYPVSVEMVKTLSSLQMKGLGRGSKERVRLSRAYMWLWLMTGSLQLGKSRESRTRKEIGQLVRRLLFRKREFTIRRFVQKDKGTVCFAVDCSEGILVQQMGSYAVVGKDLTSSDVHKNIS